MKSPLAVLVVICLGACVGTGTITVVGIGPEGSGGGTRTGGGGGAGTGGASSVSVAIAPKSATVEVGGTLMFAATVTGSSDDGVTWSVQEGNGGRISAAGLYTAPAQTGTYHVVATSHADSSRTDTATVTAQQVQPASVRISPAMAAVGLGGQLRFMATVMGASGAGVIWSASAGRIDETGLFTAPTVPGTVMVNAVSQSNSSLSGQATVSVLRPFLQISPPSASVAPSGKISFSAVVVGGSDNSVTWSATAGTIDQNGQFTAPASNGSLQVTARSKADPTLSAVAPVTVTSAAYIVTCVGDSITQGYQTSPGNSYPSALAKLLGSRYTVKNFGHSGASLMKGPVGYWDTTEYGASTTFAGGAAGEVVIQLGTNDSNTANWPQGKSHFLADCEELVEHYKALPSAPRVWVNLPPPVPGTDSSGIDGAIVRDQIIPLLKQCAMEKQVRTIDVFSALLPYPNDYADGVHPNDAGAAIIARTVYDAIIAPRP